MELAANDRCLPKQRVAFFTEPGQAPADYPLHPLRQADLVKIHISPTGLVRIDDALLDQMAEDLLDEEGVAISLAVKRADESIRRLALSECCDDVVRLVHREAAEGNALIDAIPPQVGKNHG